MTLLLISIAFVSGTFAVAALAMFAQLSRRLDLVARARYEEIENVADVAWALVAHLDLSDDEVATLVHEGHTSTRKTCPCDACARWRDEHAKHSGVVDQALAHVENIEATGMVFVGECAVKSAVCTAQTPAPITAVWVIETKEQIDVCRACFQKQLGDGAWTASYVGVDASPSVMHTVEASPPTPSCPYCKAPSAAVCPVASDNGAEGNWFCITCGTEWPMSSFIG